MHEKLAFEWYQRAVTVDQLNGGSSLSLAQRCLVIRLDCLLESALTAQGLELYGSKEEAENWYWIYCLATHRMRLARYSGEDWRISWCNLWAHVSMAILMVTRLIRSIPIPSLTDLRVALHAKIDSRNDPAAIYSAPQMVAESTDSRWQAPARRIATFISELVPN